MTIYIVKENGLNHCESYNIFATTDLDEAIHILLKNGGDSIDIFYNKHILFNFSLEEREDRNLLRESEIKNEITSYMLNQGVK